ncbi:MAG: Ger(x)C family spore germination protein [Firmicutes bacterium]|nr:Ger(x)C family spore germination protein [Bacillota bacterium]
MLKKGFPTLLLFVSLPILLAGCWGAKEIDEAAYAFALGIDSGPGRNLTISVLVFNPGAGIATAGITDQSLSPGRVRVFTAEAPSIFSGINIINTMLKRQIELGHLKMVVFGETLARRGIESYLDTMVRWRKFRRTIYLAVANQGTARRVIESIVPPAGTNAGKYLEMMFITQGFVGFTPRNQMLEFYNALKTKGEVPVAALVAPRVTKYDLTTEHEARIDSGRITDFNGAARDPGQSTAGNPPLSGEAPLQFLGTAVLYRGKLVQKLTGYETLAFSMLRGEFNRTYINIPDPEAPDKIIQLEISRIRRPEIKLQKQGAQIRGQVLLTVLGDLIGVESNRRYETPPKNTLLKQAVENWIKQGCYAVFHKAQTAGTDIFGFGDYARWLVPDWESWRKWDWGSSFKTMKLDLTVKVHINRPGLIIKKNAVKEE